MVVFANSIHLEGRLAVGPMTERAAELLDHAQAASLAVLIDLQARWENLRTEPTAASGFSVPDLQGRQRAYETYRSRRALFAAKYREVEIPDMTLSAPDRVGTWCRVVRAVFQRAEGGAGVSCPTEAIAKAFRLADRIAARLQIASVDRGDAPTTVAAAIRELDVVIRWCDEIIGEANAKHLMTGHVLAPAA